MRPKSMATVVSLLRLRVSSVMSFSVESTVISLMVRMSVVLPAANGPVTTILTALPPPRRRFLPGVVAMSEPPYAGDEPQQEALVDTWVALDKGRVGHLLGGDGRGAVNLADDGRHAARGDRGEVASARDLLVRVLRTATWAEWFGPRRDHLGRVVLNDGTGGVGLRARRCGLDDLSGLPLGRRVDDRSFERDLVGQRRAEPGADAVLPLWLERLGDDCGRCDTFECGQGGQPTQQCVYGGRLTLAGDDEQAAVDEGRQRRDDSELTAPGSGNDLGHATPAVDECQQRPLFAGQHRVVRWRECDREHGVG